MSLTDVMSATGLQLYAEVGLVFFGMAFVWICVSTFRRRNAALFERARFMALDDGMRAHGAAATPGTTEAAAPGRGTDR